MAKMEFDPGTVGFRGKLGNAVYRKRNGKIFVSPLPDKEDRPERSAKQRASEDIFRKGMWFAEEVLAHPLQKIVYQRLAKERKLSPNSLLLQCYRTPPVIERIDVENYHGISGGQICILAFDTIMVTSVEVSIQHASGDALETGQAKIVHGVWVYTVSTEVPAGDAVTVVATACNPAGRTTTEKQVFLRAPSPSIPPV